MSFRTLQRALPRGTAGSRVVRQQGLSLVELMIASLLSLIIISALTTLFVDVSKSNREMAKTNSQIENARFAMQFVQYDLEHAGYWNAFTPGFDDLILVDAPVDFPTLFPDPCEDHDNWDDSGDGVLDVNDDEVNARLGVAIEVYDTVPGGWSCVLSDKLADTDILVVRYVNTCVPGEANCEAFDSDKLYFQVSNCETEIENNYPENLYRLDPNTPSADILHERDCTTDAASRKFVQNIYYVRDYALTAGDGVPTLVRSEFDYRGGSLGQQPFQALVEGIERFRVELGLDLVSDSGAALDPNDFSDPVDWADLDERISPTNRGDGVPENYVHCGNGCTLMQLVNTVAVRMHILARANEVSPGYEDKKSYTLGSLTVNQSDLAAGSEYKRHVFTNTVRLNNIAGRRETPE